jgi:hypothetical protein
MRYLEEVLQSQCAMLKRINKYASIADEWIRNISEGPLIQVSQMLKERNTPLIQISRADCLNEPGTLAARVGRFLGKELVVANMVDRRLHRVRK